MKRIILAAAMGLSLSGCASAPPGTYHVEKTREYNQSKAKTWEKLMEYFTSKGIPIKNFEKDSGVVYAEMKLDPIKSLEYADCGKGMEKLLLTNNEVNVFVKDLGSNKSSATVNLSISGLKQFGGYPPYYGACSSLGTAERVMLDSMN